MYPVLSISSNSWLCGLSLTFLLAVHVNAAEEWQAGSRFEAGDDGSEEYAEISPYIGYSYRTSDSVFQSEFSTLFDSYGDDFLPEGWASENSLIWFSPSRMLTVSGEYDHEYDYDSGSDEEEIIDDFNVGALLSVPLSKRLFHEIELTGFYQAERTETDYNETTVDELTAVAEYSLNFNRSRRQLWSLGAEFEMNDNDYQAATATLGWNFTTSRYSVEANSYAVFSELDDNGSENLGWDLSLVRESDKHIWLITAERNQTDSLNFILSSDLDLELEEQYLVTVTEASFELSEFDLTKTVEFSVRFTIGEVESLYDLSSLDYSEESEYSYHEITGELDWQLDSRASVSAVLEHSEVDDERDRSVSLQYNRRFGDHWSLVVNFEKEIKYDDDCSWYLAADYQL